MRYYESLYIVNPNYENERLDKEIDSVSKKATELGFKSLNHKPWGKKRLAYAIDGHKYGAYIIFQFETESLSNLSEFERFMVLNKSVIRNQTVALSAKPEIDKAESSLKTEKEDDQKIKKNAQNNTSIDEQKNNEE